MRGIFLAILMAVPTGVPGEPPTLPAPAALVPAVPAEGVPAPAARAAPRAHDPAVVYTGGGRLNVRAGASVTNRVVGTVSSGTRVTVACQVFGQAIRGPRRRSAYWDRLGSGRYVADAYLRWRRGRPAVRWCARGAPTTPFVVSAAGPANVRSGPSTRHRAVGRLASGAAIRVTCLRWGERVAGSRGGTHRWNRLSRGRYVSDVLVSWRPARPTLPWCGQAPPQVPAATPAGFVARVARPARVSMRRYRVPASVTIAQAILESGWGRSRLTRRDHNYFGIKCFGGPGPIAIGCRSYATSECGGGRCWRTRAQFRAYRDTTDSMNDHGRFLVINRRYHRAFRYTRSPNRFAVAIHRAGYATSPTYARHLIQIMRRYRLYRFDHR